MVRFLAQRMEGASSAAGALAAYIRANAEFTQDQQFGGRAHAPY